MKKLYLILLLGVMIATKAFSQIVVTNNTNAQQLAQALAGTGVAISNWSTTCDNRGTGTFTNSGTPLSIPSGVVLATGRVSQIPQAAGVQNYSPNASTAFNNGSDANLAALATPYPIVDRCILEFDLVPQGNVLRFNYVFGSEEYPEWVCSDYNDVFGFFITGQNPLGGNYTGYNLARIPSTALPVAINSLNPGAPGAGAGGGTCNGSNESLAYSSYYVSNAGGTQIAYDGLTTTLQAIIGVIPCQTYHLKLAVGDAGDAVYDSGIFIQSNSLTSQGITVTASSQLSQAGYSYAYEGCVYGMFTLTLPSVAPADIQVTYTISGSATNGTDYNNLSGTVVVPQGQQSVNIIVTPVQDGIAEGLETVTLNVINPCDGTVVSGATLTISDNPTPAITVVDSTLCSGQSTTLTAGPGATFSWTPPAGLSNPAIANPTASPSVTTTYTVDMTFGACASTLQQTVYVSNLSTSVTAGPAGILCNGATTTLTATPTSGSAPFTYNWSTSATTPSITASTSGSYVVTITDNLGCTASATQAVTASTFNVTAAVTNINCFGQTNGAIDQTVTGNNSPFTYSWSDGPTTQDRTGLAAGTYNVTVTNAVGCTQTASYTISAPGSALTTSATQNNLTCNGAANGSIDLSVSGGSAPYTYNWGGGITTQDRSGLGAGTYTVTVTDAGGCTATRSVTITQPAVLATSFTRVNVACFGGNTGSINLSVTGGTTPYGFAWSNGATTEDISGLTAGSYVVTVTDANNCTATRTIAITQPASGMTVSATPVNVTCFGALTGAVNITVSSGTAPLTYLWSNGATTQNISGVAAGTYTVTVTGSTGCTATASATVTQPAGAIGITSTTVNVLCNGASTGSINITATGGTGAYTYNWGGGVTTEDRTGLAAGTYTVTVTDANGCTATHSATITQPSALAVSFTSTNLLCNGVATGAINITATGGTGAYTYNWGGGITTEDRSALAAGTYTVTVTDANSCTISQAVTITQPAALTTSETHVNVSCNGGNNGSINLTVNGGTSPYTFAWSNGATTEDIATLTSGSYTVTVTDANSCTTTRTITITQPAQALALSETHVNVNCFGGNTGSIDLTVTGGTTAYSYNWGGGVITQDRSGLAAGTYTVTVTDANLCTATLSATITQPAGALATSETHVNVNCFGGNTGSIDLNVTGGTTTYTYNWGGGVTTQDRTGLAAGTYTVTVTDANNCTTTRSVTITQPAAALSSTETHTNVGCNGGNNGSINLTVNGGTSPYTFTWSNGATTEDVSTLISGSYTVTVTDANSCTTTRTITITQPAQALALTETHVNVNCFGGNTGSIDLTVTGGTTTYSYNWGGGVITQDRSGLAAGTYIVTVTDANLCTATLSATITQPAAALSTTETHVDLLCNGASTGSINLTVTGGTSAYTYNWGGVTTEDRSGLAAGTYTVTVTDANSCTTTRSVTIAQPTVINISQTHSDISCNGLTNGSINITVSGGTPGYTYNWGGGITSEDRTGLAAGTYTVTVTDANSCTASLSVTITEPTVLSLSGNTGNSTCMTPNGTATVVTSGSGTGPYNYVWSHNGSINSNSVNGLAPGPYSVTVTDANGCSASISINVGLSGNNTNAAFSISGSTCFNNNNVVLTHTGSSALTSQVWTYGDATANGSGSPVNHTYSAPGTYNITHIVFRGFCSDTVTQPVTINVNPTASSVATNVLCFGANTGSINVTAASGTPAYSYNWGGGVTTEDRTNLVAGTYTVTVTDANSCTTTRSITITQPASALSTTETHTNVSCNGGNNGSINLTVNGGTTPYTFAWSNTATTEDISTLISGNYTVTVTDANGCTTTRNITITQPTQALTLTETHVNVNCFGGNTGSVNLAVTGGTSPYTYIWTTGATTQDISALANGTYDVTVTDANSCTATLSVTITQPATALATTETHVNINCFGGNTGSIDLTVTGGTTAYTYNWGGGVTTQDRTNLVAGTYTVTVTDANSCTTTQTVTITQPASALSTTETHTNVSCNGGNNGSINLTVNGGTSPYTFAWSNGATTEDISILTSGSYTVTVTDANGCTTTRTVSITQPALAVTGSTVVTNVSCNGGSNGAINLTVSGGTSPYTFVWSNAATTEDITVLVAGTYTVTINDVNSCSAVASATITEPAQALSITETHTNVNCFSNNTGAIDITVSGGTSPYTYNWGGGITIQDRNNLLAGTYNVTVTDANTCTATLSVTITQPAAALAVTNTVVNVSCNGGTNGAIDLTVNGGTTPYTFNWAGGVTTEDRTTLIAGTYAVTVTDANNCTIGTSISITQPAAMSATALATNVSCNAGSNGTINITVTGGAPGHTYLWNDAATTEDRSGLTAGTYSVTITDANSCSITTSATITEPAVLSLSTTQVNVLCNGGSTGSIDLTVSGGTTSYTYNWGGGVTTQDRNNIIAGTYTVTVTDANNCTASTSVTISQPSALTVTSTQINVGCFGANSGAIDITAAGGTGAYTYNWGGGITTEDRTNLVAGTYTVTVTDANSCTATLSTTITQPVAGLSASTSTTNVLCFSGNNGTVNLTVNGGTSPYTFMWNNGATTEDINTLAAGTYAVTITDANSCTLSASATVTEPAQALTLSETHTNVNCFGNNTASINLTVAGGTSPYTYNWGGGTTTQDRNNIAAGAYTVSVTDANACSATLTVTITEPAAALSATTAITNVLCFGGNNGAIDLVVAGGTSPYTYNWGGGITTEDRANLTAGTYSVTITDANACTLTANATIAQPVAALTLTETHVNVACFGNSTGSINVITAGGTSAYTYLWNDGITTEDRSGLGFGTYTLTATDANNCSATITVSITQPAQALTLSETHTNVNCFSNSTASIDLAVVGGTSPYTYNWGGVTTQDRNNIPAGTYTVSVTDANACSATLAVVITEPAQLQATTTHSNVLCNNGNTGSIDLTVSGGVTAYQFLWSNAAITEDITGLVAGTYSVTVTDGNNCTATTSATVTQPAQLQLTQVTTNALCFGNSNGAINVTTTGGTTAYQYLWSNAATTEDISALPAGTYTLTVTDANSCSATISTTVTQPALLQATTTQTDVVCFGQSNGTINLTVTGGTTNYTYNWSNGTTTQNLSGLLIGSYSVTVTDANACTAAASATITEPAELAVTELATNVSCYNGNDGSIDITAVGGSTPYQYSWSNGSTAQDISGLTAAAYTVTVTDAHACTALTISIVGQPSQLQLSETHLDVLCNGGNDGFIDLSVSGGTVDYNYSWSNGVTTEDNPNLGIGNYTVTVTDFNGCTATLNTTITQPVSINVSAAVTQVSCFGGNNGAINISVSGGIPGYTYNWSNGATTQDIANLSAGTYSLTITDLNTCTKDTTITITQPALLQATATQTNVLCFGASTGAIDVTVTGGTTPYTYSWTGGVTTQDRNNLAAGTYSLSVTDANGCSTTLSRTITQPTQLQATVVSQNITCNGANNGNINLTVSGAVAPYTFAWSNSATTEDLNNLSPAAYTVTVTDFNACSVTAGATITQPTAIQLTANTTNVSCNAGNNGAVNLTVVGGTGTYTYTWSNGAVTQDINGLTAGAYTVTVADQNNCTATISATITEPAALQLSSTFTNVACYGANNGAVNLEVLGGVGPYTYLWSNNATTQDITTLVVGTYDVTVTDANGCTATHSRVITQTPPVSINVVKTDIACFGGNTGAINITVSGGATGFTYNWSNGAGTEDVSGLAIGTYVVTVTDANNCTLSASATIAQPAQLTASVNAVDVQCHGGNNGSVNLTVNGGSNPYSFLWSNNAGNGQNLNGVTTGNYSVIITDAHGCTTSATTTVNEPAAMIVNNIAINPTCYGSSNGAIDLTANGGVTPYTYNWSNGSGAEDLSGIGANSYTVTVTDNNSCTTATSITLTQPAPMVINESHIDVTCHGAANGSVNISVTGGLMPYSFAWNTGAATEDITNVASGQYSVTVTDGNGCQGGMNGINIIEPSVISIVPSTTPVACEGGSNGSVSLVVMGGVPNYQYNWSNGMFSQSINNLPVGTYNVTVTDANSCTQTGTATITSLPSLDVSAVSNNMPCANVGGLIDLTVNNGSAPFQFQWSNGSTTEDLVNVMSGNYSVTVTDVNGCPFDTSFVITNTGSFTVDAGQGAVITLGQSAQLNATSTGTAGTVYNWNTFEQGLTCYDCNNPMASPAQTTTYTVVGTDVNGCMAEDTVTVTVISDHTVFTPNSFTPNGDGQNDTWKLFGNLDGIKTIQVLVFDRWGEKVFESEIPNFEWDAIYKGEALPPAVYVYVMKIVFLDGSSQKVYKGGITLLR